MCPAREGRCRQREAVEREAGRQRDRERSRVSWETERVPDQAENEGFARAVARGRIQVLITKTGAKAVRK